MRLFDLLKPSFLILPVVLLLSSAAFAEPASKSPGAQAEAEAQTEAGVKPGTAAEEAEAEPQDKSSAAEPEDEYFWRQAEGRGRGPGGLENPGQYRQVAAGDDRLRRRHREIHLAGVDG